MSGAAPGRGGAEGRESDERRGERVILDLKPDPRAVIADPLWLIAGVAALVVLLFLIAVWLDWWWPGLVVPALMAVLVRIVWECLWWIATRYRLTSERLIVTTGVIRRVRSELPLRNVQHTLVLRRLKERLAGLGTVVVSSASALGPEIVWEMVDKPYERMEEIRRAALGARGDGGGERGGGGGGGGGGGEEGTMVRAGGDGVEGRGARVEHPRDVLVIGLIGGVGAGKSAVAAALAEAGAVVIDSDREVRAVLERAEVKAELVRWWGGDVVKADGSVDRGAIARIVFANAEERARLEGLVHPLVKVSRARIIAEGTGRARGEARAEVVVIDAPLLLEAGVDEECDAVMFVDTPWERRVEWVKARGWDGSELERRERAQWSLERKWGAADVVVRNDGTKEELRTRTLSALEELRRRWRAGELKRARTRRG